MSSHLLTLSRPVKACHVQVQQPQTRLPRPCVLTVSATRAEGRKRFAAGGDRSHAKEWRPIARLFDFSASLMVADSIWGKTFCSTR